MKNNLFLSTAISLFRFFTGLVFGRRGTDKEREGNIWRRILFTYPPPDISLLVGEGRTIRFFLRLTPKGVKSENTDELFDWLWFSSNISQNHKVVVRAKPPHNKIKKKDLLTCMTYSSLFLMSGPTHSEMRMSLL